MTPVRAPDVVRGDVPGLLCRGMPLTADPCDGVPRDQQLRGVVVALNPLDVAFEDYRRIEGTPGMVTAGRTIGGQGLTSAEIASRVAVDWSDRAAIYLCLAWLADRGHICTWMLPTTHGGRVEAWDGLTAWEVSAILVARSVLRVARGLGPVSDVLGSWRAMANSDPDTGATWIRSRIVNPKMRGGGLWVCERLQPWRAFGWECSLVADPERTWTWLRGPETGDAGKLAADRAALAYGCVLHVPGGLILPDLGADHE